MTLGRGERLGHGKRPQGHALVELHVVSDHGGFADDDAGAVIDDDWMAQGRPGVNVYARPFVSPFGQHARQERHAQFAEAMGDAVDGDGQEAGVGQDDLVHALGRGVAALDGRGIDHQLPMYLRQSLEELLGDLGRIADVVLERPQQRPQFGCRCVESVAHLAGRGVCPFRRLREKRLEEGSDPHGHASFGQPLAAVLGQDAVKARSQTIERIARGLAGLLCVDRSQREDHGCLGVGVGVGSEKREGRWLLLRWCRRWARPEARSVVSRGASGGRKQESRGSD